jgi:hypothetical protein
MVLVNKCLNCLAPITQPLTGRRRLYCSDRCRKLAHRARQQAVFYLMAGGSADSEFVAEPELEEAAASLPDELLGLPADPDEAVVLTVREAWGLVARLARCGERARPELAWRCQKASKDLAGSLRRYFEAHPDPPRSPGD